MSDDELVRDIGLMFFDIMHVRGVPSDYARCVIKKVREHDMAIVNNAKDVIKALENDIKGMKDTEFYKIRVGLLRMLLKEFNKQKEKK